VRDVLAHLVLPVRPVVAALWTPIVQRVADALAGKDFGKAIGRAAVLPRAGAGGDVNVAGGELAEEPRIAEIREIVHGIVEIEIVVVHTVHEVANVVYAGHREAALDDVGMLEERVGGMIRTKGSAHGGNGNAGALAIVPNEWNDLLAKVRIEDGLHVAAVKRMCALAIKAKAVDGIDAEEFYSAAVKEIAERANHALAFELAFVTGTGRKAKDGLSPVAVDDDPHVHAESRRIPAMIFAFHNVSPARLAGSESMPAQPGWGQWN
jgi:hypothetical protein